jgi:hypothetical protein
MYWEYMVMHLAPGEPTEGWEAIAAGYSKQLTAYASEGWEVCEWALPWVVFRRGLADGAGDQAKPVLPQGDIPLGDVTKELLGTLRDLRKAQKHRGPEGSERNEG